MGKEKETERQIEKLERLRKVFREAEIEKNKLEGRLSGIVEDIKKRYNISTIGEANSRIKDLSKKKKELSKELEDLLDEMGEEFLIWEES